MESKVFHSMKILRPFSIKVKNCTTIQRVWKVSRNSDFGCFSKNERSRNLISSGAIQSEKQHSKVASLNFGPRVEKLTDRS